MSRTRPVLRPLAVLIALLAIAVACARGAVPTVPAPAISLAADVPAPPDQQSLDIGPVSASELGADLALGGVLFLTAKGDPGAPLRVRAEIVDVNGPAEALVLTVYADETLAEALLVHPGPFALEAGIEEGPTPE